MTPILKNTPSLEANPSWGDLLLIEQLVEHCLLKGVLDYIDVLLETAERESTALGGDAEMITLRLQLKSFLKLEQFKLASELYDARKHLGTNQTDALGQTFSTLPLEPIKIGRIDTAIEIIRRVIAFDSLTVLSKSRTDVADGSHSF